MQPVIIIGASGHAKVIADILERMPGTELVGFVDAQLAKGDELIGYPILGEDADIPILHKKYLNLKFVLGIGSNALRARVAKCIAEIDSTLGYFTAIHPAANIARNAQVGEGSVVMANATIAPCAKVGKHCIVNHLASLDHDSCLGDFSSLAPGAITGGHVMIGEHSAICMGASVAQGIRVGDDCTIGAGAVLLNDAKFSGVYYGVPAKLIRQVCVDEV